MKTHRKLLHLKKTQIAKINSFNILGKGSIQNSTQTCGFEESRTPKGGAKTQTDTTDV